MTKLFRFIMLLTMMFAMTKCPMSKNNTLPSDISLYQYPMEEEAPYFILKRGSKYELDFQFYDWCFIRALNNDAYGFVLCSEINVDVPSGPLAGLTVVVDAGHGGLETGAQYFGTAEKDINLAVSLLVAGYLREAGANVVLTRKNDETVRLYTRPSYANLLGLLALYVSSQNKAERTEIEPFILELQEVIVNNDIVLPDLYKKEENMNHISPRLATLMSKLKNRNDTILLSIHGNSSKDQALNYRGTEIIYATNKLKLEYPGYEYYDDESRKSLRDELHSSFLSANVLPWRKTYFGDYAILRESNVPSLLIELGFINHEEENRLLKSEQVQEGLAKAIYNGVVNWYMKQKSLTAPFM